MYHKFGLTQYEIINYCMYPLWKVISVKGKSLWENETETVGDGNVFTYTNKLNFGFDQLRKWYGSYTPEPLMTRP